MDAERRVELLVSAYADYLAKVSEHYDEVVDGVAERVRRQGDVSKLDIAALVGWKRIRADARWMRNLMSTPDIEVRAVTREAVRLARDDTRDTPDAARDARGALCELDGLASGDAVASTICFVAAPSRLAVYDQRAHRGLGHLELELTHRPGRYGRYIAQIERCRRDLADHGYTWPARHVDLALYQLGDQRAFVTSTPSAGDV